MKRSVAISLVFAGALSGACTHRKPLAVHDAGPAVEVVEADKHGPARPQLPMVDEQEPDDDTAHAQPLPAGSGVRGSIGAPRPGPKGKPAGDEDVYSFMAPGTAAPGAPTAPVAPGAAPGAPGATPGAPTAPAAAPGAADASATPFDNARIEVTGVSGLDLALDVLDGDGKRLTSVNDGGPGEGELIPNLAVDPAHTYFIRVRENGAPKGDPDRRYELTVQTAHAGPGDEREPNDDPAHATVLRLANGTSGDAAGFFGKKRDDDWLRLPLAGVPAADGRATLRLEFAPVEGVTAAIKVQGDAPAGQKGGAPLFAETKALKAEELRLRNVGVDVAGGAVLIDLRAVDGRSADARWTVRLGVEPPLDGAEREPNNDAAHATALPLANGTGQLSGFLWPGDVDVYRLQGGSPNDFVSFDLEGVDKVDLKLERIGADGKPFAKADDAAVGQGEALPPARLGDGLVRVSARAHDTAFDAPYRLTATIVVPAPDEEREPNNDAASATPWLPGATAMRGRLAPRGDEDWYALNGDGAPASVRVEGPLPATARIVDEAKKPVPPGAPLAAGRRYFVVVKAASERASNARDLYTVTISH